MSTTGIHSLMRIADKGEMVRELLATSKLLQQLIDKDFQGEFHWSYDDEVTGKRKRHLNAEGASLVAQLCGLTVDLKVEPIWAPGAKERIGQGLTESPEGYLAVATLRDSYDGTKIGGRVEMRCLRSEKDWRNKADFQLASMAQTRAMGKCVRQSLGHVLRMADLEPTPAEEVVSAQKAEKEGPDGGDPIRKEVVAVLTEYAKGLQAGQESAQGEQFAEGLLDVFHPEREPRGLADDPEKRVEELRNIAGYIVREAVIRHDEFIAIGELLHSYREGELTKTPLGQSVVEQRQKLSAGGGPPDTTFLGDDT